ncbi:MAG: hypothetical protein R6V73_10210 [Anaerolineales bacterium]|jgi:excinuclease UvrABC ATPase subunit
MIIIKTIAISFYLSKSPNKLVVLAGLSGSEKFTLEFDIPHKEGQRNVGKRRNLSASQKTAILRLLLQ